MLHYWEADGAANMAKTRKAESAHTAALFFINKNNMIQYQSSRELISC